ncbi:MAG: plasma-membrane proton-efflux P-type ATPase [Spirochaetales bacterium]|nr:plasma-membrane proton-efflux P-type ATPase [Spirochaetales bacterium]
MDIKQVKKMSAEDILEKLSSKREGLDSAEVDKRLKQYGYNELSEKKTGSLLKFLSYFWGPIPWMIEVAAGLSALIQRWEDFGIIIVLLLLNAGVAFWQEHKADAAIDELKKKLAPRAKVLRNGEWIQCAGKELVPGDIIRVRSGDIVPADMKFMEGDYASIDESALTGESLPVDKNDGDVGYSGSIVRQGEMTGVVFATGMETFFGKTAKLIEGAETVSHFQKAVVKIAHYLIFIAIILVFIIIVASLFRQEKLLEILQFCLVLTVASIPVAMPAVLSVTMAIGASALAKKEAIVSKLVAIEEMAGMDILCSDKTGTITKNEISIAEVIPFGDFRKNDILLNGWLASKSENMDAIDNAVIGEAENIAEVSERKEKFKLIKFKPFNPVDKRTESLVENEQGQFKISKGAPQIILSLLTDKNDSFSKDVGNRVKSLAEKGYRSLGVAKTDADSKWQFIGLIALHDPPRDDSAETIKTTKAMGLKVKMVTGDHVAIAQQIARETGLGTDIREAGTLMDKPDRVAARIIEEADGFAQVYPEHKYHIVELLQNKNHIVGMTGDGVNDAPALKKSDAGIAVEGATDAAKSAASIVLTKPGLSVIVDAIKESRKIFQRMNNYSTYRIAETIRILLFFTLSILIFNFYPVTALMIVLLALLNDAPIMTIAYDRVVYSRKPDTWNMRTVLTMASFLGVIGVIQSFLILFFGKEIFHLNNDVLQSFIYLKLSVSGHFTVFVARTKRHFWQSRPALPMILAVICTQVIATLITVYGFLLPPLGWALAGFIWGQAIIVFLIVDFIKVKLYKLIDHTQVKFKK